MAEKRQNIFRAYDVRGIYGKEVTEEIAERIGKAFGTFVGKGKVAVGRDIRLSSASLRNSLVKGLLSSGCSVVDFEEVPTPIVYFGTIRRKLAAGVMVTASHLPAEWNGFKMCDSQGIVYSDGTGLESIREIFERGIFAKEDTGNKVHDKRIIDDYRNFVKEKIHPKKKLRLVIDFANSVTSLVIPKLVEDFGFECYKLYAEIDGRFPNRASEPNEESLQKLREKVLETNADLGIGFDGDGDRVAFVDEKGRIFFSGNTIIPVLARYLLQGNPNRGIVFDISCSQAVEDFVKASGGIPIVIRVGHSYCSHTVLKENALLGGQYSGHYAFPEIFCIDDAMYAAAKILELVSSGKKAFSEIVDEIPRYSYSPMQEISCEDSSKFKIVENVKRKLTKSSKRIVDVDGVKAYTERGWVLVRASNTAPMIRIVAEGKTREDMLHLFEYGRQLVEEEISKEDD